MSDQLRGFSMMAYEGAISCTAAFGGGCRLFISSLEREREIEGESCSCHEKTTWLCSCRRVGSRSNLGSTWRVTKLFTFHEIQLGFLLFVSTPFHTCDMLTPDSASRPPPLRVVPQIC